MSEKRRLLTPEEVSTELSIPKTTLYKLCNSGQIPAVKIGKHWRFDREKMDLWLEAQFQSQAKNPVQEE
jgi:excisionase family DNA binding protein